MNVMVMLKNRDGEKPNSEKGANGNQEGEQLPDSLKSEPRTGTGEPSGRSGVPTSSMTWHTNNGGNNPRCMPCMERIRSTTHETPG